MNKKILVIDDDIDILSIAEFLLKEAGFEPLLRQTGQTADEVSQLNPDLILLDVRIERYAKSGLDICKELKAHPQLSRVPVILFSSENDLEALAQICGADGYITKPFDINVLLSTVTEFVS